MSLATGEGLFREPIERLFDYVAGDLLVELGYESDRRWAGDGLLMRSVGVEYFASRVLKHARWRAGRLGLNVKMPGREPAAPA